MAPVAPLRSIRIRIGAAFFAAIFAMLGSLGFLIAQQAPVTDSLVLITKTYLPLAGEVAELKRDTQRVQRDLNRINQNLPRPVTGETSAAKIYTAEMAANIREARQILAEAPDTAMGAQERAALTKMEKLLEDIEQDFERYERLSAVFLEEFEAGASPDALAALRRELDLGGARKSLTVDVNSLESELERRIDSRSKATFRAQTRARAVAVVMAFGTSAVALMLILAVLYALRPIGTLTAQVQRFAAGDFGGRVEVGGSDEVGVLASEFNAMARAIETRDKRLQDRADELKRLSRYLGSVVETLEEGLVVVEHGRVSLCNPAARRVWGVIDDAPPPDTLADAIAGPNTVRLTGPDETVFVSRSVRFGESGMVTIISDVTDQVRAQERLARSERLALIGQMLAQITHEVRNPLNALSLNAELLGDEVRTLDPEEQTEAHDLLGMISAEVERLTDVTGHYLQLARRPPARLAPTDLRRVVEEVARLLEPELDAEGVVLELQSGEPLAERVDANQLRQALINVVRNAVEAGARRLVLSADRTDKQTRVTLHDDGPGMSDAEIRRACDPFFSTKAAGTGLGLAITRQILEDHDGQVLITSRAGEGTTVVLAWPSRPVDQAVHELLVFDAQDALL
jgi:signal transduction histidine kinase